MNRQTIGLRAFGLVLGALVAGCVHPPPVQPQLALGRTNCDATPVLADAVPILFDPKNGKPTDAWLGDPGRCVQTADAVGDFYASFALPRGGLAYTLQIGALPKDFRLLAPEVRLLNDRGEVTRSFTVEQFLFRGNQLSILVRPRPEETTLVVLSDHRIVGQSLSRIQEGITISNYSVVSQGGTHMFTAKYGYDWVTETTFSFAGDLRIMALPPA